MYHSNQLDSDLSVFCILDGKKEDGSSGRWRNECERFFNWNPFQPSWKEHLARNNDEKPTMHTYLCRISTSYYLCHYGWTASAQNDNNKICNDASEVSIY